MSGDEFDSWPLGGPFSGMKQLSGVVGEGHEEQQGAQAITANSRDQLMSSKMSMEIERGRK